MLCRYVHGAKKKTMHTRSRRQLHLRIYLRTYSAFILACLHIYMHTGNVYMHAYIDTDKHAYIVQVCKYSFVQAYHLWRYSLSQRTTPPRASMCSTLYRSNSASSRLFGPCLLRQSLQVGYHTQVQTWNCHPECLPEASGEHLDQNGGRACRPKPYP